MRILVVDDDPLNRFLLTQMLEEEGYDDCYEAENGEQAIDLAEKIQPDVVLLDIVMPDMDGYEVAPILKRLAGATYLPVIFITALDDQDSIARCLEVGGDDFVAKPFNKTILAAKIKAHARTRMLSIRTQRQNHTLKLHQNNIEREHAIVEHIFENGLETDDSLEMFFDSHVDPASNFNGDMLIKALGPNGNVYVLLGDFTGHGLSSAIGALPTAKTFNAMAQKGISIAQIAYTVNDMLLKLLPDDMFFAAALIEIDESGKHFSVWNGSMPQLSVFSPTGVVKKRFESQHMAMGILDRNQFDSSIERYEAEYGDRLIGFSDGVIEVENPAGEMLGEEGIENIVQANPQIKMPEIIQQVHKFRENQEQLDDFTMVQYIVQPLDQAVKNIPLPKLPFKFDVDLGPEQIRETDPVHEMLEVVFVQQGLQRVRADLFIILSELYNNSLDHGLLGLDSKLKETDSGFVKYFNMRDKALAELSEGEIGLSIEYDVTDKALHVYVHDSGPGFDVDAVIERNKAQSGIEQNNNEHGRGLLLINELADEVTYSHGGTSAYVRISLA